MASAAQPARVPLDLRKILKTGRVATADLKPLVWTRMRGDRVGPGEDRTTLLIDFVHENHRPSASIEVRRATAELLRENYRSSDVIALGELCALGAAICGADAFTPLQQVMARSDALTLQTASGESLRHRAFRSLVAVLIVHRDLARGPEEASLRDLLYIQTQYPESRILALTALIGLWPEAADRVREGNVLPGEQEAVNQLLFQSGFTQGPVPEENDTPPPAL